MWLSISLFVVLMSSRRYYRPKARQNYSILGTVGYVILAKVVTFIGR